MRTRLWGVVGAGGENLLATRFGLRGYTRSSGLPDLIWNLYRTAPVKTNGPYSNVVSCRKSVRGSDSSKLKMKQKVYQQSMVLQYWLNENKAIHHRNKAILRAIPTLMTAANKHNVEAKAKLNPLADKTSVHLLLPIPNPRPEKAPRVAQRTASPRVILPRDGSSNGWPKTPALVKANPTTEPKQMDRSAASKTRLILLLLSTLALVEMNAATNATLSAE